MPTIDELWNVVKEQQKEIQAHREEIQALKKKCHPPRFHAEDSPGRDRHRCRGPERSCPSPDRSAPIWSMAATAPTPEL